MERIKLELMHGEFDCMRYADKDFKRINVFSTRGHQHTEPFISSIQCTSSYLLIARAFGNTFAWTHECFND